MKAFADLIQVFAGFVAMVSAQDAVVSFAGLFLITYGIQSIYAGKGQK